MSRVSNAILLMEILSNGKKYSIEELSNIIEVTPRMIRSYKEDLEKAGIFIDTIRGPYGGYVLNQSVRVPRRKFSLDDYEFLNNLKIDGDDEKIKIIADKIHGIYFSSKDESKEIDAETKNYYNQLSRAIKEHRKVLISYYSYNKGINERVIHPYDLFYLNNGWGVAAFCESKKDIRHFELKRIESLKLLEENF